jgi:aminoglycoside phosphotransferase (APT) family kinase protein
MQRDELERLVGERLAAALSKLGLEVVAVDPVTTLLTPRSTRASYRLELSDGSTLKARRMKHAEKAARMTRILAELSDRRFARVLFAEDDVVVEEWVAGTPLSALPPSDAEVEACAAILGSLHGRPAVGGEPVHVPRSTRPDLRRLEEEVAQLIRERALMVDRGQRVLELARRSRPETAMIGLIHGDFCPENIVRDEQGLLRVVDNESLRIDHLDYDLARTWLRWPMPAARWQLFLARYRSYRAALPAPESFVFWQLLAILKSAGKRLSWRSSGVEATLRRLDELLME